MSAQSGWHRESDLQIIHHGLGWSTFRQKAMAERVRAAEILLYSDRQDK